MEMQDTQAQMKTIEGLLEENNIEEAIAALLDFDQQQQAGLRQDIVQQSGNFKEAQKSRQLNLIGYDEYNRAASLVRYALLGLIKQLRENTARNAANPEKQAAPATPTPAPKPPLPPPVSAIPKFVIVYDLADSPQCQLLNKHLNVLKFTKKIRVYNVQEALSGELLANAEAELADADYLLALVTVNLFNSPDWFGLVFNALEQGRRVIPIRIEKADYDGTGLEKLRSLPSLGRAVSDFPNLDAAYADIVTELKKLLPK